MSSSSGAATGIVVARPTITIDGTDQPALTERLLNVVIVEQMSGLYRCEVQIGNWGPVNGTPGFLYFDRKLLDFGKGLQVKLGSDVIFDGRILALEASFPQGLPPRIGLLAEDRFQDLRMTRRTRSFAKVSDANVFTQIAGEYGLSPQVNLSGPTYAVLAQVNQSDLAFVRERARAIDAELWMDGRTLNAQPHSSRNNGTLQLVQGGNLREFTVLADLAGQRTSVAVNGWDVASKSGLHYEATDSIIRGELNGDASGASILQAKLGERKESLAHTVPVTSSEAQAEAEAYFKMMARRFLVGRGVASPDKRLRVGGYVDLQGLGPLFSGKYYLAETRYLFDTTLGSRVEFTAERAGLGQAQ